MTSKAVDDNTENVDDNAENNIQYNDNINL